MRPRRVSRHPTRCGRVELPDTLPAAARDRRNLGCLQLSRREVLAFAAASSFQTSMELSVSTVCRAFQVIFSAFLFLSFGSEGLVRYAFRRSQPRSLARHSRSELGDRGWQRQSISHLWPFVGEVEGALVKLTVILSSRLFKQTVLVRASAPSPCSNIYSVITRWCCGQRSQRVSHDYVCEGRSIHPVVGRGRATPAV